MTDFGDRIMTATGLRWGELAGLHTSGLDAAGCVIRVVQTYARLLNEDTGRWEWRIKPYPKGKKRRDVPISEELAGLLSGQAQGRRRAAGPTSRSSRNGQAATSTTATSATTSCNPHSRSPGNTARPSTSPLTPCATQ
ncbi:hypothetical protein [Planomonospora algeriensis]